MLLKSGVKESIRRYFKGSASLQGQPLPEVNKALIEDAPRVVRLTIWAIIGFFLFLLLWANFAVIDEVTKGDGKAIPSSKIQKIQNLEGGIVSEMFVKEGQIVEAGAPLIRLDDTRFASNVGETEADRLSMLLRVERLSAEVDDRPLNFPEDVLKAVPGQAKSEESLYISRRQQLHDEIGGLQEQLIQRQQELREFSSKQAQYRQQLGLQRQEINMSEPLVAQGAVSPVEVLRLKRAEVETRGQLDATTLAIPRAESAIKEVQRKIDETRGKFRSEALTQLNEARTDLNKAQATGKALEDRVSRTLVTSPVRGIVNKLLVNTIGGVIQPGSDMVEIVPLDDTLLVEAKIRPQDIAFLHPGQEAIVKFTAYDYTIYGGLKAKLEQIGADTITDEDKKTTYYMIKVRTERSHLGTDDKPLLIIPGMVASVDIITGKKSVLSYLLKPIIRARAEALHER
ncbi:HlyD family type I secretion periplasmic adaptor subunit [Pseudomonas koreensis]|uniref:HlyD family type I secretion periplasmic adaptor subunit n=1 Tax=Pseudomonas TaxID=286 RepID=UPI000596B791|nr:MULTISPECIES: HlyD family type I secretion periplasmic adaptor subunit [unclassified Pseudomonas]AVX86911.1 HlyD family type I secretion periplasmic adaptor subunit [Pseudomonas koreensis]KIK85704.1 hemolysin secretion protein D [Pseudomonas sp. W15Feb9B]MBI6948293.1 HlyD family type I secretion periplasmic adaptor subunit [Pseudomonas koreensis]MCU7217959.1 HlyD family type I secretion periplasmic adaptor subunit [Pseudomonas sp. VE 196-7]NTZ96845.1 HlyD family type I secretion periplasmic